MTTTGELVKEHQLLDVALRWDSPSQVSLDRNLIVSQNKNIQIQKSFTIWQKRFFTTWRGDSVPCRTPARSELVMVTDTSGVLRDDCNKGSFLHTLSNSALQKTIYWFLIKKIFPKYTFFIFHWSTEQLTEIFERICLRLVKRSSCTFFKICQRAGCTFGTPALI